VAPALPRSAAGASGVAGQHGAGGVGQLGGGLATVRGVAGSLQPPPGCFRYLRSHLR